MEDIYITESKITTTTKFSTMETTSCKLSSLSIRDRISKLGQHLYILQTSHTHSDPTTEYIQCFMVLCEIRGILPVPLILVYGHVIMHAQCTAAK